MEIGSFLELQLIKGKEFYNQQHHIARLNSGRAALWYAFKMTGANAVWLPIYLCNSVREFFIKKKVKIKYYHIDENFNPIDLFASQDEAVILVNYFGIMSHYRMSNLAKHYFHPIIDNSQGFFCKPLDNAVNVYSCRKFIGVPDGSYVIGNNAENFINELPQCYSSETSLFLLKRIEYGCEGSGYNSRNLNENRIDNEDVMKMSILTHAILDSTDYDYIIKKRRENFTIANDLFGKLNMINPTQYYDSETIPMVYPLVIEDDNLLHNLIKAKHFQGHWWSYICSEQPDNSFEYWISKYVIPITIDQRYGREELLYIANVVNNRNKIC